MEEMRVFAGLKQRILCATILSGVAMPALAAAPIAVPMVTASVDDNSVVALAGNHAAAIAVATDAGAVDATHVLSHVILTLKRSPASQAALDRLVTEQQTRGAANYHHWLTAAELRAYGPAQSDIDKTTAWLQARGLTVNAVSPSGMSIDFSGTAAQIGAAFRTSLHAYTLRGEAHMGNTVDASVPVALTPVLAGVTLSNFFPKSNAVPTKPLFTVPIGPGQAPFFAVVPQDFATIYNLLPLLNGTNGFGTRINGAAVTIAVVEQTNIHEADWKHFRSYFGLSAWNGQFRAIHPAQCTNPGYTGDEVEAAIDAEWAGASAPGADIVEASCAGTDLTFGVETTLQNLVESKSTNATIYSISYGGCEQEEGLPFLTGWSNLAEEAAAEGISIVISAGDSGSSCDRGTIDSNGLGVNGLAANPYVTSVGGTDFYDTALGETASYWRNGNFGTGHGSAKSYVPEIPWDNSCANSIVAQVQGNTTGLAYCNGPEPGPVQNGVGGTGGASLVYAKPSWQLTSILGMPNDGVRDQPDVSLFAANGIWNHAYLICMSDETEGGAPCIYKGTSPSGEPNALFQAYGGTSVAAPAFAGILALETQLTGAPLGNAAPRLYQLAQAEYSNPVLVQNCNATLGNKISLACVFNSVTAGDNAEPCVKGTPDCHAGKTAVYDVGVLAEPNAKGVVNAYPAAPGYNLATGLGSVNATNLLYNY
jgi:subtilase family serine protease